MTEGVCGPEARISEANLRTVGSLAALRSIISICRSAAAGAKWFWSELPGCLPQLFVSNRTAQLFQIPAKEEDGCLTR